MAPQTTTRRADPDLWESLSEMVETAITTAGGLRNLRPAQRRQTLLFCQTRVPDRHPQRPPPDPGHPQKRPNRCQRSIAASGTGYMREIREYIRYLRPAINSFRDQVQYGPLRPNNRCQPTAKGIGR